MAQMKQSTIRLPSHMFRRIDKLTKKLPGVWRSSDVHRCALALGLAKIEAQTATKSGRAKFLSQTD